MLENKKLEESSSIIRMLINERKIIKPKDGTSEFFIKQSRNSLIICERLLRLFTDERLDTNLWVINSAYYSMFFAATSLLAKFGHKINTETGVHKLTYHALVHYFINEDNKLKNEIAEEYNNSIIEAEVLMQMGEEKIKELVSDFNSEMVKKKSFTYELGEIAERKKAETSYNRAKKFFVEIEKLLR